MRRAEGPPVVPITPVVPGEPGSGGGTEPGVPGWPVTPPEIDIGTPEVGAPGLPETPWVPPGYVFVPPTIEIPEGSTVVILPPGVEPPPGAVVLPPNLPGVPPGSVVVVLPPGVEPPAGSTPVTPIRVEIPPVTVEIPPIEVPRIEVPPVRVEIPRIEVPRIEAPPVEVPRVEIPQMPDVLSDLRRLVTNTLFNFDLPKLKDILGLFPDPMLKVYTVRNYVLVQPPPMANWAVWWPPSGYRYIMAGPMFIESEYYSDQVTFGVQVDGEWITQEGGVALSSSMVLDVPARYFVRGEEIYVAFINNTDVTFKVWFTFLVVAATQEYYERWWAPLVRHTYESVKWTVDWFTRR